MGRDKQNLQPQAHCLLRPDQPRRRTNTPRPHRPQPPHVPNPDDDLSLQVCSVLSFRSIQNDYVALNYKFGLKQSSVAEHTTNGQSQFYSESVAADNDWRDQIDVSADNDGRASPRTVRFTLTYMNRYEGFFPLNQRAQQMLEGSPLTLTCRTDFEDWEFPLYVDWEREILYNQQDLPFFGCLQYSRRRYCLFSFLHHDTVRLYWHRDNSRMEQIRCLELNEAGDVEEFFIPAAEYECEINEYVVRAEKRLEDPMALFKQAQGRRGLFQTMCEVFGASGAELSFDELFNRVMAKRMVAAASIRYQLQERACFVALADDRWRFEPQRGAEQRPLSQSTGQIGGRPPTQTLTPSPHQQVSTNTRTTPVVSPMLHLLLLHRYPLHSIPS